MVRTKRTASLERIGHADGYNDRREAGHQEEPGLGGWSGRDLVSLYVMLGIGIAIMLYVRFKGGSDYFSLPRETYQPEAELQPANPEP